VAFDPEIIFLPAACDQLWCRMPQLSYKKKVQIWYRLLGQFALIGCASDVTSEYCPKIKDVTLPANHCGWLCDGIPWYLDIVWYNWKGQKAANAGMPYHL
jgi:hypothetical protein